MMNRLRIRRALILGTASVAIASALAVAPAAAHTDLVSSTPADGSTLSAPPTAVSFTFSEALLAGTSTISINDATGQSVSVQQVEASGATVSADWPAELTSGAFQIAYRVVADDGHPITGAISIGIGQPPASAMPITAGEDPASGIGLAVSLIGIAILGAVLIGIIVLIRRRRR